MTLILGMLIVHWIIIRLLIIERVPYKIDETITLWQMYIICMIIIGSILEIKVCEITEEPFPILNYDKNS